MRSSWRWVGLAAVIGAIAVGVACGGGSGDHLQQPIGSPDAGSGPGSGNGASDDGGSAADAGSPDAGLADAGPDGGIPDAGPDGGIPDAGPADAGTLQTIIFPATPGWDFYGPQNGGPQDVRDVAMDEGGNLWVAGGREGLFLMRADATGTLSGTFEKFGIADGLHPYGWLNGEAAQGMGVPDGSPSDPNPSLDATPVISLAGGPAGTIFVGYQGKPGCESAWHGDQWTPPAQWGDPAVYKSGDADRVTLTAGGISVVHYDIFSGPGMVPNEIKGREKLCTIHRLVWDKQKNLIWFGGNHGFAAAQADAVNVPTCNGLRSCSQVLEHSHPAISGCAIDYDPVSGYCPGSKTLWMTDSYFGVAIDPASHDMWMGGSVRTTKFRIATLGDFFAAQAQTELPASQGGMANRWDLWPDQVAEYDATRNAVIYVMPSQRSTPGAAKPDFALDDGVSGIAALNDGTAWVSSFSHGLIHIDSSGTRLDDATASLASRFVSSLALDPLDGSVWAGMAWGLGISRINAGAGSVKYQGETFGSILVNAPVASLRAGIPGDGASRRILAGFRANAGYAGAIAIYKGM